LYPGPCFLPYGKEIDSLSEVKTELELLIKLRWLKLCIFDAIVLRFKKGYSLKGLIEVLSWLENDTSPSLRSSENR
jgi:hypothetical protein